jgi:hypothetical protein
LSIQKPLPGAGTQAIAVVSGKRLELSKETLWAAKRDTGILPQLLTLPEYTGSSLCLQVAKASMQAKMAQDNFLISITYLKSFFSF